MSISYSKAKKEDLSNILNLIHREQYPDYSESFLKRYIVDNDCLCVVAKNENDTVVAVRYGSRFCGDIFEGRNFLVAYEYRGQGIGSELSYFMFDCLRDLDYKITITGNSSFYAPVLGAVENGVWRRPTDFYLRLGYQIVASSEKSNLFVKNL